MMILPFLFELYDFTLVIVKRSSGLPHAVTPFALVGLDGKKKAPRQKANNALEGLKKMPPDNFSSINRSNRRAGRKRVGLPIAT